MSSISEDTCCITYNGIIRIYGIFSFNLVISKCRTIGICFILNMNFAGFTGYSMKLY